MLSYLNSDGIVIPFKGCIICGFPGVGKSSLVRRYRNLYDLDSAFFTKDDKQHFPKNIISTIKAMLYSNPSVSDGGLLVSTHKEFLDALVDEGLPHLLVIPHREMKYEDWVVRYQQREDSTQFIEQIRDNWEKYRQDSLTHAENNPTLCTLVELRKDQFLKDVIKLI